MALFVKLSCPSNARPVDIDRKWTRERVQVIVFVCAILSSRVSQNRADVQLCSSDSVKCSCLDIIQSKSLSYCNTFFLIISSIYDVNSIYMECLNFNKRGLKNCNMMEETKELICCACDALHTANKCKMHITAIEYLAIMCF